MTPEQRAASPRAGALYAVLARAWVLTGNQGVAELDAATAELQRLSTIVDRAIALESAASRGAYMREHMALCEAVRALKQQEPSDGLR